MRLTREKIIRLSHQLTDVLVASNEVEFVEDRDTIRQQVVKIFFHARNYFLVTLIRYLLNSLMEPRNFFQLSKSLFLIMLFLITIFFFRKILLPETVY